MIASRGIRVFGALACCALMVSACISEGAKKGIGVSMTVSLAPLTLHPEFMACALEQYYEYIYPLGTERATIESHAADATDGFASPGKDYGEIQLRDRIVFDWGWSIEELREGAGIATPEEREALDRWLAHATQDEYRFQVSLIFDKHGLLSDERVEYLDHGAWVTFEDTGQFDDPDYLQSIWQPVWEFMEAEQKLASAQTPK